MSLLGEFDTAQLLSSGLILFSGDDSEQASAVEKASMELFAKLTKTDLLHSVYLSNGIFYSGGF